MKTGWLCHDAWNSAGTVAVGRFTFLEETADLGRPVCWTEDDQTLLWHFWLQSFNYIFLLPKEEQIKLCHEWIAGNAVSHQPGWHPYPLSRRIINWCKADLNDGEISRSLYQQATFLFRNLEIHLGGNHLLENARALVLVSRCFDGDHRADKWWQKGLSLFETETAEQILSDGWHYERSPMYHALMLEGYLDVLNLLPGEHAIARLISSTARRMIDALVSATRPDGQITLLNDATEEIAPQTVKLVEYSRSLLGYDPQSRESFPDAGYYTYRDDKLFIFIDGGEIGPDHLPAHAHADIFSYELSLMGIPFIVDTGVYEYQEGEMRHHVRHTRAHNTVCIDGVSQAECWKSFRVARRYPPKEVSYRTVDGKRVFHGRFDGYARLIGDHLNHERKIVIDPVKRCVTIEDIICGRGEHEVESLIHLHPDVQADVSNCAVKVSRGEVRAYIHVDSDRPRSETGWYCPRMGTRIANTVLVIRGQSRLPISLRYVIEY